MCSAEGGHLAIINSKEEAAILKDLFNKNRLLYKTYQNEVSYLGFFKWSGDEDWITVHGKGHNCTW